MLSFLLSLSCTTLIMVIFRELNRYEVSLFKAITVNYLVCVILGIIFTDSFIKTLTDAPKGWLPLGIFQGCLFITIFFLIGQASQKIGVAYTAMITKVSVIFPVLVGLIAFKESMTVYGYVGIALALISIILLHLKYFGTGLEHQKTTTLPLSALLGLSAVLFFGTGTTDSVFAVFRHVHKGTIPETIFLIAIFGIAGCIGLIAVILQFLKKREPFGTKNLIAGVILGVPNYFSIYFLMDALQSMPASQFFPLLNISILLVSAVIGYFKYDEKFQRSTWVGMILAVGAIILIAFK